MKKSFLIQRLFDAAIGNKKLPIPKSQAIALRIFFRIKDKVKDYIIDYPIGANKLSLPVYLGYPGISKVLIYTQKIFPELPVTSKTSIQNSP